MEVAEAEFVLEPLAPAHDRSAFSCGEPVLDEYLRHRASQDVRRRVARAFVAVDRTDGTIAGYYTLSAASFSRRQLPEALARRLPHYPVPAAILGRLAIDRRCQGRGLGTLMLADAVKRVLRASETLAIHAIIVDAKNDRARTFYERFGFVAFTDAPDRLYLPLATALQGAAQEPAARRPV
ncbi:MAG: GNAT family N-acetyltransferase [Geminicoccaceae bacterium]